jgi:hypothetical protein
MGIWSYYHELWSIALQCFCNISDMVAIDALIIQRTSLRGNIHMLQQICVGGERGQMQQTMVDGNRWYDNATHKVRGNNAYCNQNQWLPIILSQRG